MPERLRNERDRRAFIDRVAGMRMAQPVGGDGGIDARPLGRCLDDVVDAPLGDRKHVSRIWGIAAELVQIRGKIGRDENVAGLVALADDGKLRLTGLTRDDLRPGKTRGRSRKICPLPPDRGR